MTMLPLPLFHELLTIVPFKDPVPAELLPVHH
jgi:hypothetical protein